MGLTEVIVLEVGTAIAKNILKFWLRDRMIVANSEGLDIPDIPTEIIDVLLAQTSDKRAPKKVQQQFKVISDIVEKRALPLFEMESVHLDKGSRTALVLAIAEAFNKSHISNKLLLECNLDPSALVRRVLSANPSEALYFNEIEADIYHHVIKEICTYIMDQAPQLPAFKDKALAEILNRDTQITDITIKVLNELQKNDIEPFINKKRILALIDSLVLSREEKNRLLSTANISRYQATLTSATERYTYDVALSFAGEDRHYAAALAGILKGKGIRVFYDQYEKPVLWGKDLYSHFSDLYQNKAYYCVIFTSQHYAIKAWTKRELQAAQARALRENKEYILPVRLDDTEIPGLLPTIAYLHWHHETVEAIADAIMEKLGKSKS